MCNIACGMQDSGLHEFARSLGASCMSDWKDLGLYDEEVEGWGQAFSQVVSRTLAAGGTIHFSLTGLDVADALAGDPEIWVGRYTAYELQQICWHADWLERTKFWSNGRILDETELIALGIVRMS